MKKLILLPSIPIFIYIFFAFCSIPVWDYDFWWHLKTGELILKEHKLPEKDVFSFTSAEEDPISPGREKFILRQYWLAQGLMYLTYLKFGFAGIKALRAALLTLTLMLLFFSLARRVSPIISYGALFLAFDTFSRFSGERPQLFSFLFFMALVLMLERAARGKKDGYLIPPLMLVWANMHGGFILGDLIIAVFLIAGNLASLIRKSPLPKTFNIIGAASILFSFINPNTYHVITEMAGLEQYYSKGIQEFKSPYQLMFEKTREFRTSFMALIGISTLPLFKLLLGRDKKEPVNWGRYAAIYILLLMSLKSARYAIFYATAGAWLMALESEHFIGYLRPSWEKMKGGLRTAIVLLLSVSAFVFFTYKATGFDLSLVFSPAVNRLYYPFGAVKFIKENRITGRLFNDYGWGGFLIWNLYPENKVFIDSRGLNYDAMQGYSMISQAVYSASKEPTWEMLLQSYDIDFILIPPVDMDGRLVPLIVALYENDGWPLIHADHNSLLFARNTEKNKALIEKNKRPSDDLLGVVISTSVWNARFSRINPAPFITLGDVFLKMGKYDYAKQAYRFALQKDPANARALEALKGVMGATGPSNATGTSIVAPPEAE